MASVPELIVSRLTGRDVVTYTMPNQVTITATKNGVTVAGNTVVMGAEMLNGFFRVLKWARKIHLALKRGAGIPLQQELEGTLTLLTAEKDGWRAWYQGHAKDRFFGSTQEAAIAALRSGYVATSDAGSTV
jgi:hypothetical protein